MGSLGLEEESAQREALDVAERRLWVQFARASTPDAFCRAWLALQSRMIDGVSGAVILLGAPDQGPFSPIAAWPSPRRDVTYLTATAERALTERRGFVAYHEAGNGPGASPGPRCDVAYPIEVEGKLHGVVVLDVSPRPDRELQEVTRQLHWGAAWLELLFQREEAARNRAIRERLQAVLDLLAAAFGQERFYAAATAFVTAVATRLGYDRVSLGFRRRGRTEVRAVSHSVKFGQRTNLVRALAQAMDEAIDQQATIVYPAPAEARPLVTRAHAELARQHGEGAVCSLPFGEGERILGALTLERPAERPFDAAAVELGEALAALAGPVLERQRRDDRWLVTKAMDSTRTLVTRVVGRGHLGLKASLVAVAAVVVFLALAEGSFRVSAQSALEPVVRQAAVAPFNGYILQAPARAGDVVRKGQVLATLDDRELRLERLKWLSQHEQLVRQYHQARAARNAAQVGILTAQIDQARAEMTLLDDRLARTRITAPFDGIVVTGDLSQSLAAPVERGQVLFEVAPLDAYRIVLQVDERDIALVKTGQRGTLVLTGAPGEAIPLTVEKLTPVSTAREGRNYFRVEARLDGGFERLRPGMEGVVKIEIDRQLVAWIWTRQIQDWIRLQLWTWLP